MSRNALLLLLKGCIACFQSGHKDVAMSILSSIASDVGVSMSFTPTGKNGDYPTIIVSVVEGQAHYGYYYLDYVMHIYEENER